VQCYKNASFTFYTPLTLSYTILNLPQGPPACYRAYSIALDTPVCLQYPPKCLGHWVIVGDSCLKRKVSKIGAELIVQSRSHTGGLFPPCPLSIYPPLGSLWRGGAKRAKSNLSLRNTYSPYWDARDPFLKLSFRRKFWGRLKLVSWGRGVTTRPSYVLSRV
jgi:hypothetical protein